MPVEGIDETSVGSSYPAMERPGTRRFQVPMSRLDVFVFDNDAYMWVSEDDPPTFNDPSSEMRLYKGFQSVPFETPIVGVKFRAKTGTCRVTVHAFA